MREHRLPRAMDAARTPFLVLVSRADAASLTIRDALLERDPWSEVGAFHGLPVRRHGEFLMAEIEDLHIESEFVDRALREAGWDFSTILVASRHRAESGKPALTVHPIGNPRAADFGGFPGRLVPTDPVVMGRVLRRLHAEAAGLKHQVTFEATHHGPYLETPTMFVEIGTDESAWADAGLGRRVARAILAAAEPSAADDAPVLVALGGSHYAPKATDLVKKGRANFGHILPSYHFEAGLDPRVVLEAIRQTPGCQGYFPDPRANLSDDVLQVFGALEMGRWSEGDL